jgi:hypothetical protein
VLHTCVGSSGTICCDVGVSWRVSEEVEIQKVKIDGLRLCQGANDKRGGPLLRLHHHYPHPDTAIVRRHRDLFLFSLVMLCTVDALNITTSRNTRKHLERRITAVDDPLNCTRLRLYTTLHSMDWPLLGIGAALDNRCIFGWTAATRAEG